MFESTTSLLFWIAVLALPSTFIVSVLYNLKFHPLAHIPGPKLAAATQWYEFYFDILKWPGGQYMFEVDRMHGVYGTVLPELGRGKSLTRIPVGPIVRVSPHEVHIKDPEWFDTLFCSASAGARDKWPPAAKLVGTPLGIFGTVEHDVHRIRRAAVSNFFSKKSIAEIEPCVQKEANKLCDLMQRQFDRDGVAELRTDYFAYAADVISGHAFDEQLHLLDDEDAARKWRKTIGALAFLTPLVKQLPWLIPFALRLPVAFWNVMAPSLAHIMAFHREMRRQADAALSQATDPSFLDSLENTGGSKSMPKFKTDTVSTFSSRPTVFQTILLSNLPPEEKSRERLRQEGFVFMAAGGETVGRTIMSATYYIIANKDRVLPRLKQELATVIPDPAQPADVRTLETLPWLSAIIRETLRVNALFTARLPLVAPSQSLIYGGYTIPKGVPISMNLTDILLDPKIFHEPLEFRPERWLSTNPDREFINRFYVPFSKGTRACIGMGLAVTELYIALATVFRRFDLELSEVDYERDVKTYRDCFVAETRLDSKGVHVKPVSLAD
ncbi:MAG: hypothetical protein Q9165_004505 [Trypethelium subeluteriae]